VVSREIPFDGLPLFFDHCETISDLNIERIKSLGGRIAVQQNGFSARIFCQRYGAQ
jgi:predicted amidohydrolase YtcJ